jgi:DNA-binding MarR family transcriptional regulator
MAAFLELHGKTNKAIRDLAELTMRRHGLYLGQDRLLAMLWERDGRTPSEIAAAAHVSLAGVAKMASRMIAAGLLTKRADPDDNRQVRLWLTATGRKLQRPVEAERQRLEEAVTTSLTREEEKHLMHALAKVHDAATALLGREAD